MFPGHGAGKGDKERSSGWRNFYDEIDFHRGAEDDGFKPVGLKRIRKTYALKLERQWPYKVVADMATGPDQSVTKCSGCDNVVDPEVCQCGELRDDHGGLYDTHNFIPRDCTCNTLV